MTALEQAQAIVEKYAPRLSVGEGMRRQLRDDIHKLAIENANAELEKRREAERQLEAVKTLQVIVENGNAKIAVTVDGVEYEASMIHGKPHVDSLSSEVKEQH